MISGMTNAVQQIAPSILEAVKKANNILLHCHPSPDPDSVGSGLAMYHVLKAMGKNVTIIKGDSHLPESFAGIPGFKEIAHKNYFDIDHSKFDLFIIQDSGALSQISKFEPVVFPKTMNTVVIDHHSTNPAYGKINLIDATYPAVAQMLYDVFTVWGVEITHDVALCLLAGMYTDTGGFQFPATTEETFMAAAALRKIAGTDYSKVIFSILNSRKPKELAFMGLALSSIHLYFNEKVAISEVSHDALLLNGISETDIPEPISSLLKSVVGWNIAITATEKHPGVVSLSMRTRDSEKYDVSKLAVALGGGGHKPAAGASLMMPFDQAKAKILAAIKEVYPELGQP
jgi:phosphoesterase RecJ-like protein